MPDLIDPNNLLICALTIFVVLIGGYVTEKFPFSLEDIQSWIVRRKDGVVVHYKMSSPEAVKASKRPEKASTVWTSYGSLCNHEPHPDKLPAVFLAQNIGLWIADASGARKVYHDFDVAIDGGSVLTVPGEHDLPNIYGDPGLRGKLARHVHAASTGSVPNVPTRIIKLRWFDREAPPVYVTFWPALIKELLALQLVKAKTTPEDPILRVLTICQGGHGRSGTALTSLMMCLSDYTPLEALTHIRALHCARAIESKVQHLYLNSLAELLGRDQNALEAETVNSFRERFLSSPNPLTEPYKDRLRQGGGVEKSRKDDPFCAM